MPKDDIPPTIPFVDCVPSIMVVFVTSIVSVVDEIAHCLRLS